MGSNSFNRFLTAFFAFAFFFIFACTSDGSNEPGTLDGTWEKDDLIIEISGNAYLFKYEGENHTKGTVTYTDSTFVFIITHDWYGKKWVNAEVQGRIFGNYMRIGEVSAFSEVYSDYGDGIESDDMFNGEWKKIK